MDKRLHLGWESHYAFEGDGDRDLIRYFVSYAQEYLSDFSFRVDSTDTFQITDDDAEFMVLLRIFLFDLQQAMANDSESLWKIEIKGRNSGPVPNLAERARRGHDAAAAVETRVYLGEKQEAAISNVMSETGIGRTELFEWLRHRRRWRERA